MLSFNVNRGGRSVGEMDLAGAYLVGSEGVPLPCEVEFRDSQVVCAKRADGPAGLALLWPVPGCGALLLETSRLMDREKPYNLALELARGRLMRIDQKREDWGLFDFEGVEHVAHQIDKGRQLFIEAVKADSLVEQSRIAEEALKVAITAGEHLTRFHADLFRNRRKQSHGFSKRTIGCAVDLENTSEGYRRRLREAFDFVYLPVSWRMIEPKQQEFDWRAFDSWVEWLAKCRIPIKMGPLVSFHETYMPDWLIRSKTDFEALRSLVFEHVRRIVERYSNYVYHWDVISGIHARNAFNFTFERLMELTRVTASLVKQLAPRAQAVIDLVAPWGEYYARDRSTFPPMLYADMVVQSGVGFDGLGAQFLFGARMDGMFVRDMFQISEKLDRLSNLGKPVHITAVQVPSQPAENGVLAGGGCWIKPWDEKVQARWLKEFYAVALSKPFVESITWRDLADRPGRSTIPGGGLLRADLSPKPAFKALKGVRSELLASARKSPAQRTT